jgi:alanyl-tRNA synthetase
VERQHQLEDELRQLQSSRLRDEAGELLSSAVDGRVVARRDGLDHGELRELALSVRDADKVSAVGLIGSPDGVKVALVVAVTKGEVLDAKVIAAEVAKVVGGGGGGSPELATAGGRDVAAIDTALALLGDLFKGE